MYQNIYNILFSTFIFQSINTTTASISSVLYLSCKQEEADTIFSVSVNSRCTKKMYIMLSGQQNYWFSYFKKWPYFFSDNTD